MTSRLLRHPVRTATVVVVLSLLIGGSGFALIEGVSLTDGLWWAFVSMTTVGYGDLSPKTVEVRMLATLVIAGGIAATAILTGALAGASAELRLAPPNATPGLDDDIDHLIKQLEAIRAVCKDPRVEAALREVHTERYYEQPDQSRSSGFDDHAST